MGATVIPKATSTANLTIEGKGDKDSLSLWPSCVPPAVKYNSPERRSERVLLKAPVCHPEPRRRYKNNVFEETQTYRREHTWRDDRVPV